MILIIHLYLIGTSQFKRRELRMHGEFFEVWVEHILHVGKVLQHGGMIVVVSDDTHARVETKVIDGEIPKQKILVLQEIIHLLHVGQEGVAVYGVLQILHNQVPFRLQTSFHRMQTVRHQLANELKAVFIIGHVVAVCLVAAKIAQQLLLSSHFFTKTLHYGLISDEHMQWIEHAWQMQFRMRPHGLDDAVKFFVELQVEVKGLKLLITIKHLLFCIGYYEMVDQKGNWIARLGEATVDEKKTFSLFDVRFYFVEFIHLLQVLIGILKTVGCRFFVFQVTGYCTAAATEGMRWRHCFGKAADLLCLLLSL